MESMLEVILIAVALIIGVGLVVGAVLRHHIGHFFETVEREAREQERQDMANKSSEEER